MSVGPRLSSFLIDLNEDDINMADCSTMLPVRTDQTLQICGYPLRDVPQNLLDRLPPHVVFNEYGVQVCLYRVSRKPAFCICENKDADQLLCNCAADQRLCFPYIAQSFYFLNRKFQASSHLLSLYSLVYVGLVYVGQNNTNLWLSFT